MHNAVVIKSSKAGMTVILDPGLPFDELLEAIAKKFSESPDDPYIGRAYPYCGGGIRDC